MCSSHFTTSACPTIRRAACARERLIVSCGAARANLISRSGEQFYTAPASAKNKKGFSATGCVRGTQMPDHQEYRQHARDCLAIAATTNEPDQRQQFLVIMQAILQAWVTLAEQADAAKGSSHDIP
jgi:hypothetical protein